MNNDLGKVEISSIEWWLVVGVLWFVDGIQILLDFLLIGFIFNRIVDIVVAFALGFYLLLRGQMDWKGFLALVVVIFGEEVPGIDALPFWGGDGLFYMWRYKKARATWLATEEQKTATNNSPQTETASN